MKIIRASKAGITWLVPGGALVALLLGTFLATTSTESVALQEGQQLKVTCAKWQPSPGDLKSIDVLGHSLSDVDVQKLQAIGLKGQVLLASSGMFGTGPRNASVLIVMQRPLQQPITLAQPDGTDVIYLQTNDGWKVYPSDAKMLNRKIRLTTDPRQPNLATLFMVEHIDGSNQGGTLITWSSDPQSP